MARRTLAARGGSGGACPPPPVSLLVACRWSRCAAKTLPAERGGPSRTATRERACMECVRARELWAHPAHGQGRLARTGPSARSREQQESGGLAGPWRWLSRASEPRPRLPNRGPSQKLRAWRGGGKPAGDGGGRPTLCPPGAAAFPPQGPALVRRHSPHGSSGPRLRVASCVAMSQVRPWERLLDKCVSLQAQAHSAPAPPRPPRRIYLHPLLL